MKIFYFEEVPEKIKVRATAVCERFAISGSCDPMYVANVIAYYTENGDGEGDFNDNIDLGSPKAVKKIKIAAESLCSAYRSMILKSDLVELEQILKTGEIYYPSAIIRGKEKIEGLISEREYCNTVVPFRVPYLTELIQRYQNNVKSWEIKVSCEG